MFSTVENETFGRERNPTNHGPISPKTNHTPEEAGCESLHDYINHNSRQNNTEMKLAKIRKYTIASALQTIYKNKSKHQANTKLNRNWQSFEMCLYKRINTQHCEVFVKQVCF